MYLERMAIAKETTTAGQCPFVQQQTMVCLQFVADIFLDNALTQYTTSHLGIGANGSLPFDAKTDPLLPAAVDTVSSEFLLDVSLPNVGSERQNLRVRSNSMPVSFSGEFC